MLIHLESDYLRKIFLCLAIVLTQTNIWLQTFVLFMTSIVHLIAINWLPISLTNQSKAMETFNEIKLIVITYHMMLFTDFVGDADT